MCHSLISDTRSPIKLWTDVASVEPEAMGQLRNVASLPWVFKHVAVMPDVHFGKGATVGSVIAMRDAVSPAAVGVDIGCGMGAVRTSLTASDLPDSLRAVRSGIEEMVPVGTNSYDEPVFRVTSAPTHMAALELMDGFTTLAPQVQSLKDRAAKQLGTLGGGNHFIELCLDTQQRVWLMLHSGSRHIGLQLASLHITRAKELAHNADLPDRELSVFLAGTQEMEAYRRDLYWAQRYAFINRQVMLERCQTVLQTHFPQAQFEQPILCHHNYVAEETHFGEKVFVTRKGAIRAERGDLGIIPGSMGTGSYIVRGLGNPDSFSSASHGAGRRLSRTKAKKHFTVADLEQQTAGVECRKDNGVLDEIPGAYKDIQQVMANQSDLVEVVTQLKQVMCVKG